MRRTLLVTLTLLLWLVSAPASGQARTYAPVDSAGPELSVPEADLDAALTCSGPLHAGTRNPVLLVHGTNLEPRANFDWNYARDFAARAWTFCTVALPVYGLDDIQVGAEYVVHALRTMSAAAGRDVDVVGYSQGGMIPRWALRFWPDTRALVGDLVGLAPSNHGTTVADTSCQSSCPPAHWQQASQAEFIDALNSHTETFPGIDYTSIYTHYDEIVVPNADDGGSSSLRTGDGRRANIALQDVCPANTADHMAIGSYDAVAHALVVDALTHGGPADESRIDTAVCTRPFQPGVDPTTFATDYANYLRVIGESGSAVENTPAEPPLRCHVTASCAATRSADPEAAGGPGDPAAQPNEPTLPTTGGGTDAAAAAAAVGALLIAIAGRRATIRLDVTPTRRQRRRS